MKETGDTSLIWEGHKAGRDIGYCHLEKLLEQGGGEALDHDRLLAPLPRAWQWPDGSAFPQHGEIGSGTVSNADYGAVGSSCLSERRAIEIIAGGKPETRFLRFGDRVRMEMLDSPFGVIDQHVVQARGAAG